MRKFPISARHVACMYIGSADSSKFPLLILTPNCLLTYFVTHRQYFHLIVNKMYVFLGIIYAIYELFKGIGIGYGLRNWSILQKTEKTISLTIFLLLFILGVSIGSNSLIVNNLGKFGWQAIILAVSGVLGSLLAARLVLQLFFKKGGKQ